MRLGALAGFRGGGRMGDRADAIGGRRAARDGPGNPHRRPALRELLELKDPQAILAKSGWRPGL